MAQNGGSNGLRLQTLLGEMIVLRKVGVRTGITSKIPARNGQAAREETRDHILAQVGVIVTDKKGRVTQIVNKGTTLIGFFSTIESKVAAAGDECVVGTLIKRPVANAVEEGQFTYDTESLDDDDFTVVQDLLIKDGWEKAPF